MEFTINSTDLPLYGLFTRLRQAGLPLGVDEYELLLRALQSGFGIPDRAALARLCKTLWVKSADEERLFNYHFEQVLPQPTVWFPRSPLSRSSLDQTEAVSANLSQSAVKPTGIAPASTATSPLLPTTTSEWILKTDDEVQVAKAVLQASDENDDSSNHHFIQSDEYFPITRRQMKQSWRYLRRTIREGPPVELDVKATVSEIGRNGILLKPVFVSRRVNRTELLLLIDQGGSMVPFHALSRRLAETAQRGGRLAKPNICYFHNCPQNYLYRDPAHQEAEAIQDILKHLHPNRAGILIFSDAGAARGGLSLDRINTTEQILQKLKQRVRYIAWLNPVPRTYWHKTTAEEIMHFVPMFDVSRRGLDEAIRVLRGQTSHFIDDMELKYNE